MQRCGDAGSVGRLRFADRVNPYGLGLIVIDGVLAQILNH